MFKAKAESQEITQQVSVPQVFKENDESQEEAQGFRRIVLQSGQALVLQVPILRVPKKEKQDFKEIVLQQWMQSDVQQIKMLSADFEAHADSQFKNVPKKEALVHKCTTSVQARRSRRTRR